MNVSPPSLSLCVWDVCCVLRVVVGYSKAVRGKVRGVCLLTWSSVKVK